MSRSPEDALREFEAIINERINPERSRNFDRKQLEAGRAHIEAAVAAAWPRLMGERVSIVGSNAKGSTAFYLAGLAETLYQTGAQTARDTGPVGLYTSPHLHSVLERIRLNREPLDARHALDALARLEARLPVSRSLSYFELLTALAWLIFQETQAPLQIFEAGLGGRFDATRIVRAQTVVLTRIELEHTSVLGNTPRAILAEKLGIISTHCQRICYMPQPRLSDAEVRAGVAAQLEALAWPADLPRPEIHAWSRIEGVDYRQENLAFARFTLGQIVTGSAAASPEQRQRLRCVADLDPGPPPGRLERRELGPTPVYFDVAHNPPAIERALGDLAGQIGADRLSDCEVWLAVLADRDLSACAAAARAAGFSRLRILSGPGFATPPTDLMTLSELPLADPGAGRARIASIQKSGDCPAIALLGSHRIYNYFVDLTEGR